MSEAKKVLNEVLVDLFNHILYIEENNLKAQGIDLSMNEVHTIEAVYKAHEPIMTTIANNLNITIGTLSTTTNRLEKKGYLIKKRDVLDKRVVKLELTAKAYPVMEIHNKYHEAMVDKLINELDEQENIVLANTLVKILDFFNQGLGEINDVKNR